MRGMALTDAQRGPRATWLRAHRHKKFGPGDGGLVALAVAMRDIGFDRSWSTYKGWESSDIRSPIPDEAEPYLERLFKEKPPAPATEAETGGWLVVAAAIDRLAKAQEDRDAALDDRLDRIAGSIEGLADALLDLATRLTREHVGSEAASGRLPVVRR